MRAGHTGGAVGKLRTASTYLVQPRLPAVDGYQLKGYTPPENVAGSFVITGARFWGWRG